MSEPDEIASAAEPEVAAHDSLLRSVIEMAVLLVVAFGLAMVVKTYVVQPFLIPSGSMERTLLIGDRVLVNKFIYRFRTPQSGDVVVFLSPEDSSVDFIKRVIAVGGQTVEVRDGTVYVDGTPRTEPFVTTTVKDTYTSQRPVTVPPGYVWLMGDNRTNSRDSRFFGPRPVGDLLGQAMCVYWPLDHMRTL
jgi:signal peptidase I